MSSTTRTARLMAQLAEAETTLQAARKAETRTQAAATRATARLTTARTTAATARRELRTATRTGNGLATAQRRADRADAKVTTLTAAAQDAKTTATEARRTARTAARRLNTLARRAALAAARTVERIAHRLGETSLTPAAETDRVLDAAELPTVEEIEATAAAYDDLDQRAKNLAKQADAMKTWLRALPTGQHGQVIITRTPGRSVLDSAQIALDYAARGQMPPRKATRTTFKCDATALRGDLAAVAA